MTLRLTPPFLEARKNNRLGLIIYTIPGFPDVAGSNDIISFLQAHDEVSVIENTIPVSTGFSDHANATIRAAHTAATKHATEAMVYERWSKPSLCVLYKSTSDTMGFDNVCRRAAGIFDGMILEWSEPNEHEYVAIAEKHGIELVQCIGPWMDDAKIAAIMNNARDDGLVYLMSAEMTGAKLFDNAQLEDCIARGRKVKPNVVMAAGFGVRTAADVRQLAACKGLDGVIIGTEFLRQVEQGVDVCKAYLREIFAALER